MSLVERPAGRQLGCAVFTGLFSFYSVGPQKIYVLKSTSMDDTWIGIFREHGEYACKFVLETTKPCMGKSRRKDKYFKNSFASVIEYPWKYFCVFLNVRTLLKFTRQQI